MAPPTSGWGAVASAASVLALVLRAPLPALGMRRGAQDSASADENHAFAAEQGDDPGSAHEQAHCHDLDPLRAEGQLSQDAPGILRHGEKMVMAFGVGQIRHYFTDSRIISRPRGSLITGRTTYQSLPYESVKAFTIRTGGLWLVRQTHLDLYTTLPSLPKVVLRMADACHMKNRTRNQNFFHVGHLLSKRLLGVELPTVRSVASSNGGATTDRSAVGRGQAWLGSALAWLRGGPSRVDAGTVERDLRKNMAVLGTAEKVLFACKTGTGYDTVLMTRRRIIHISVKYDAQGVFEETTKYTTIPYESVKAFAVQATGRTSARMDIWTEMPALEEFGHNLIVGAGGVGEIQRLLSDSVLGAGSAAPQAGADTEHADAAGVLRWIRGSPRLVDPREAEKVIRSRGMLQAESEEHVLMAFRCVDFSDNNPLAYSMHSGVSLLTSKRLLLVEAAGSNVMYKTIPYHAIRGYKLLTAGDFGMHGLKVWTGVRRPSPLQRGGDMSEVTFKFKRGRADRHEILAHHEMQQILSTYILGFEYHNESSAFWQGWWVDAFYGYVGNKTGQLDLERVGSAFREARILSKDETVFFSFRHDETLHIGTSRRLLSINRRSRTAYQYQSIPYSSMATFAVAPGGLFEEDLEFTLGTVMPSLPEYKVAVRRDRINVSGAMVGPGAGLAAALLQERGGSSGSLRRSVLGRACGEIDAAEADRKFKEEVPILLLDEQVLFACRTGRSTTLLTSKRVVTVDPSGLLGNSVSHATIPYGSVGAFSVASPGGVFASNFSFPIGRSSSMELHTLSASNPRFQQEFPSGEVDVFKEAAVLAEGVIGKPWAVRDLMGGGRP